MYQPKQSVKQKIFYYMKNQPGWVSGMDIEAKAFEWGSKRIGRTLRDLSSGQNALLEKKYTEDKHAVLYRIAVKQVEFDPNAFLDKLAKEEQGVLF